MRFYGYKATNWGTTEGKQRRGAGESTGYWGGSGET